MWNKTESELYVVRDPCCSGPVYMLTMCSSVVGPADTIQYYRFLLCTEELVHRPLYLAE